MQIFSLLFQTVNFLWKIVVQNACCIFAYFYGGHKKICGYNSVASLTFPNDDFWNFDETLNVIKKINIFAFIQIYDFSSFLADFN